MNDDIDDRAPALTVRVSRLPEAVVVAAAGDLDIATAPRLRAHSRAALDERPKALIVDLGAITYCGSAGLQVIAELAAATAETDLPFTVVTDRYAVLRALQVSRLDSALVLHPTVERARRWIAPGPGD